MNMSGSIRPRNLNKVQVVRYFMGKCVVIFPSRCWIIPGISCKGNYTQKKDNLYPQVSFQGKNYALCRLVNEVFEGEPNGRHLIHSCNNNKCINPNHIRWGSRQENMFDRPYDENNSCHKIRYEDVVIIHELLKQGYTQREIADRYGCSQMQISRIKRGVDHPWVFDPDSIVWKKLPEHLQKYRPVHRSNLEHHQLAA